MVARGLACSTGGSVVTIGRPIEVSVVDHIEVDVARGTVKHSAREAGGGQAAGIDPDVVPAVCIADADVTIDDFPAELAVVVVLIPAAQTVVYLVAPTA